MQIDDSTQVMGSCTDANASCAARVYLRRDGRSAADVFYWSTEAPVISVFAMNTTEYRFERSVLVLRDGMQWRVARGLRIDGCGADDQAALMRARFGATFQLDAANGVVDSVACNGCA